MLPPEGFPPPPVGGFFTVNFNAPSDVVIGTGENSGKTLTAGDTLSIRVLITPNVNLKAPYFAVQVRYSMDLTQATGGTLPGTVTPAAGTIAFVDFPTATIVWAIWAIMYQQIENNLIQPRIQAHAVDVQPFVVLVAVLFGSTLFGVLGALLAVPVAASIQIVIREILRYRKLSALRDLTP